MCCIIRVFAGVGVTITSAGHWHRHRHRHRHRSDTQARLALAYSGGNGTRATPRPTGDRGEVRAASQIPERSFRLGLGTEWHSVITALYGRYSINIVNNSQSQSQRLYSLIGTVQYGLGLRACGLCYSSSGKCTVTRIML